MHVLGDPHVAHRSPAAASRDQRDADALFALHSSAYVLRYWGAPP